MVFLCLNCFWSSRICDEQMNIYFQVRHLFDQNHVFVAGCCFFLHSVCAPIITKMVFGLWNMDIENSAKFIILMQHHFQSTNPSWFRAIDKAKIDGRNKKRQKDVKKSIPLSLMHSDITCFCYKRKIVSKHLVEAKIRIAWKN